MRKTEIKSRLQDIIDTIQAFRDDLHDILEPYYVIESRLDDLYEAQEQTGIILEVDYDYVQESAFRDIVKANDMWSNIGLEFNNLICDFEEWEDEVSQRRALQIREVYIEVLENIRADININEVDDECGLDHMLIDIQNKLIDFKIQ